MYRRLYFQTSKFSRVQVVSFTPATEVRPPIVPIFMKISNVLQRDMRVSYMEFYPNRTIKIRNNA